MGITCSSSNTSSSTRKAPPPPLRSSLLSHSFGPPPPPPQPPNRPHSLNRGNGIIVLDSETHSIQTMNSNQFQIIPSRALQSNLPPPSFSNSALIVPNHQRRPLSSRSTNGLNKVQSIDYKELTLKQLLGQGTYGEVFRGYYKGRKVAVKKIFPGANSRERMEVISDFDREITILRKLDNQCSRVCKFVGFVNENNQPLCLVFELCEGSVSTLLKMVRKRICLVSWRICLNILRDTAEACAFLHSQGIIHRDLKAENLLLESNFHCKLTDFGLSREVQGSKKQVMTVCGTPCWVAPEIFRNEPYDFKVDVYSFGILMWEVLASKKPYNEAESGDLCNLVGNHGLRPAKLAHIPKPLQKLMNQCWEESPMNRPTFPMIIEILDDIIHLVGARGKLGSAAHNHLLSTNASSTTCTAASVV